MSRDRSFLSRSSATKRSSACSTSPSGRRTSMPLLSRRFQRRSATKIEARNCVRMSGWRSTTARKSLACRSAPRADDQRQAAIAILDERLEDGAVFGDDTDASILLPQRKGMTLGDGDLQAVGIKLEHRRVGDPGIRQQPRPRRIGVEEQERRAAGHAGGGEDFFAADFLRVRSAKSRQCEIRSHWRRHRGHPSAN